MYIYNYIYSPGSFMILPHNLPIFHVSNAIRPAPSTISRMTPGRRCKKTKHRQGKAPQSSRMAPMVAASM